MDWEADGVPILHSFQSKAGPHSQYDNIQHIDASPHVFLSSSVKEPWIIGPRKQMTAWLGATINSNAHLSQFKVHIFLSIES